MKDRHVIEELSAYMDGEARDPARIARHLQHCESCARHHMQLLKLSTHLHALPLPEPRPEFLTRVMAQVAEEKAPSPRLWFPFSLRAPAWAMSFAMVLIVTGLALGWFYRPQSAPLPMQRAAQETTVPAVSYPEPSPLEDIGSDPAEEEEPVSYEDLLNMLAEVSEEDMFPEMASGDSDFLEQMETLDVQAQQALREVLSDYLTQTHTRNNEG